MNVLIVTADPRSPSFAASLAGRYLAGVQSQEAPTVEWADLFREAFDPRMTEADLALYRGEGPVPQDVRREQLRVERADVLWCSPSLSTGGRCRPS
ncbi:MULTISPECIES: NAD(P)H-dependent oxidoreductase [unclassified Ensifer]|uniref:NAD(P)H-dependent oxidoreductase n=1 Tax=unclassified Ensifer TaxID=2633371 RepID=UPI000B2EEFBE|nr:MULTISPECIES: NAD(P)H-dependent oxidoreductase [unclassified Ensifer]MDP9633167.1 NAD(P)H dehydrogenase (quinone) [Ensifer adhaerens]